MTVKGEAVQQSESFFSRQKKLRGHVNSTPQQADEQSEVEQARDAIRGDKGRFVGKNRTVASRTGHS